MRTPLLVLTVLAAVGSAPLHAQDNTAVSLARQLWEPMIGHITTVAEELPESTYAYKPTPDVRSFGQMFGHVAGAQYMFCAAALGESGRNEDDIEKTKKTKSELVTALKASTD